MGFKAHFALFLCKIDILCSTLKIKIKYSIFLIIFFLFFCSFFQNLKFAGSIQDRGSKAGKNKNFNQILKILSKKYKKKCFCFFKISPKNKRILELHKIFASAIV